MIDAIGGTITPSTQGVENQSIAQEDFIKLFLTQLGNQDPLEPVDNSQFLAQMAQFSNLEQSRMLNESVTSLLEMNSTGQGLTLLGREVQVSTGGTPFIGHVDAIQFGANGLKLTVTNSSNEFLSDVSLSRVTLVKE